MPTYRAVFFDGYSCTVQATDIDSANEHFHGLWDEWPDLVEEVV